MLSSRSSAQPGGLRRVLGVGFGLAVIVGSTLGIGILRTPGLVAGQLSSVAAVLLVWIVGGLYTLVGAACFAELGTMLPQEGGSILALRTMTFRTPIQRIVIIFKENHSFDNYFGTFAGANGTTLAHSPNPPSLDPDHRHKAWLTRKTTAPRLQFLERDIPSYFVYARQFTIADNYFTDVAGPSTPNHLMLLTANSPAIDNPPRGTVYDLPSVPANLERAGLTWENYGGYVFGMIKAFAGRVVLPSEQFARDAAAGKLPAVSWVFAPHALSEHPPDVWDRGKHPPVGDVTAGMRWTVDQVNAIVQGGLWAHTAIFITWDDWGGWYDHVDPPLVEKWTDGTPFRFGSRVACLVLSPYARSGHISSVLYSHVSLIRFCEDTFGLPPLNARDRSADGFTDCFDFTRAPAAPPRS